MFLPMKYVHSMKQRKKKINTLNREMKMELNERQEGIKIRTR